MKVINRKNKFYLRSNAFGFTILELLVVISIIGILSSIVLTSINNSRAKARVARAQKTMESLMPILTLCSIEGKTLRDPNAATQVCDLSDVPNFPAISPIGSGWHYVIPGGVEGGNYPLGCQFMPGGCDCIVRTQPHNFEICALGEQAAGNYPTTLVTCNQTGCNTTYYAD